MKTTAILAVAIAVAAQLAVITILRIEIARAQSRLADAQAIGDYWHSVAEATQFICRDDINVSQQSYQDARR